MSTAIVWFRRDLRLADNPALCHACEHHDRIVPLYIDHALPAWPDGAASRWWLHGSLAALGDDLAARGAPLWLRCGEPEEVLAAVLEATGASAVYWNRRYEPAAVEIDKAIKTTLVEKGLEVRSFKALLCVEPWKIETRQGTPYRVFTPYYRVWRDRPLLQPFDAPSSLEGPEDPQPMPLEKLELRPTISWDAAFFDSWSPGASGAIEAIRDFAPDVERYDAQRDRPDLEGTSRLSPHLHFGEIAPWRAIAEINRDAGADYIRELAWREFSYHLLAHFPQTVKEPLNPRFESFQWSGSDQDLRAWQRGQTGIPIVDAGMRQLWQTGWMHNRVRMIVASFLTKNLRHHWLEGARWFWDTLVDADLASNTQGWQWTAGCGADAAPYFRVFNPVLQAQKFDPDSHYIKRWVPELTDLPAKAARAPWEAAAKVLADAAIELGRDYPHPIVDLKQSRERALEAYEAVRG